jgi:hypothetical protein
MVDFSIEMASERITDPRTKEYFQEVASSYSHGNFRSAVVMLWSVIICDLLFKLDLLKNIYGDTIAKNILDEINGLRQKNLTSPDWELELVKKIKERTLLLEEADFVNLATLQKHRHLSAHPVLTFSDALYSPNRETVRAHIRNALEGVLLKPAIMTKKVFDTLVDDIASMKELLPDLDSLRKFLESKYFSHLTPALEISIFKSLWKLVFKLRDDQCNANRIINLRVLLIIYERQPREIDEHIKLDSNHFSDLTFEGTPLKALHTFLSRKPTIFNLLTDAAKVPIENYATIDVDNFSYSWFLSPSICQHIDSIIDYVNSKGGKLSKIPYSQVAEIAKDNGCLIKILDLGIGYYISSGSFDGANDNFIYIKQYLNLMSTEQLIKLVDGIEKNRQTYERGGAFFDHQLIKAAIDNKIGGQIDYKKYPHFYNSTGLELTPNES